MCMSVGGKANFDLGDGTIIGNYVQPDESQIIAYSTESAAIDDNSSAGADVRVPLTHDGTGYEPKTPNTGRAMLIVLPVAPKTFNPKSDLIDVTEFDGFLKDQVEAVTPVAKGRGLAPASMSFGLMGDVSITDVGDFQVLAATVASDIPEVLSQIDAAKRPEISEAYCRHLQKLYGVKQYMYFLACFDGTEPMRRTFALRIRPQNPKLLLFPGFDSHDPAHLPEPGEPVSTKHTLIVSAPGMKFGAPVDYDDKPVPSWMPEQVRGWKIEEDGIPNGDFGIALGDLKSENGSVRIFRLLPPGATQPAVPYMIERYY